MKFNPTLELTTIDTADLARTHGGMKWQNLCASYNVEDRRRGAGTPAQQRARTDAWNRENGCPTWADLHPKKR
jgi:transcription elongation factor